MKLVTLCLALMLVCTFSVHAQKEDTKTTTIILLRHAEKDTAGGSDPKLSATGWVRAKTLIDVFKDIIPDEMYSTPYKRTQQTLMQWAELFDKTIKPYNSQKLDSFATELKAMKGKTIVVAGHSNTTPALVNALLGSSKYSTLNDSVYNKIFIVTIKKDGITDKIVEY